MNDFKEFLGVNNIILPEDDLIKMFRLVCENVENLKESNSCYEILGCNVSYYDAIPTLAFVLLDKHEEYFTKNKNILACMIYWIIKSSCLYDAEKYLRQILPLRQKLAEKGQELTPQECLEIARQITIEFYSYYIFDEDNPKCDEYQEEILTYVMGASNPLDGVGELSEIFSSTASRILAVRKSVKYTL